MQQPTTSERAIEEIKTLIAKQEEIIAYIEANRAAFDTLRHCSLDTHSPGIYCHVLPGEGREFVKQFGLGLWRSTRISSTGGYVDWKGRPNNAPCDFHIFAAEAAPELTEVVL